MEKDVAVGSMVLKKDSERSNPREIGIGRGRFPWTPSDSNRIEVGDGAVAAMRTQAVSDGKGEEGAPPARLGPQGSETGRARGLSGPSWGE